MLRLITCQGAGFEAFREGNGLTEGQSKTLTCDRIDGSRGIPDQRHIVAPYPLKFTIAGQRSSFLRNLLSSAQSLAQPGQCRQAVLQAQVPIMRGQRDADLFAVHGGRISLTVGTPVNLHVVGPGS